MNELLKAYIDGQLPAAEAMKVEQALKSDSTLRQEFDQLRRISSTLREATVAPVSVGLDKTLAALRTAKPVKRSPLLRFAPAVGLAFATCLAVVVVGRMNGNEPKFNDEIPMAAPRHKGAAASFKRATLEKGTDYDDTISAGTPAISAPSVYPRSQGVEGGAGALKSQGMAPDGHPQDLKDAALAAGTSYLNEDRESPLTQSRGKIVTNTPAKQIIKTGNLAITVKDGKATADAATKFAAKIGGYVESSDLTGDDENGMTGTMTLRVPVATFESTMDSLGKMGKITAISSNGQDVTAAVADDAARLTAMKAQEESYLTILKQAKHIDDVLAVKDRVDSVQQEIEGLAAELKSLSKQSAMSTISLTINQKAAPKKVVAAGPVKDDWAGRTWSNAFTGLASAGKALGQAFIFFVVFCPVWIPLVVLANVLTRRLRTAA